MTWDHPHRCPQMLFFSRGSGPSPVCITVGILNRGRLRSLSSLRPAAGFAPSLLSLRGPRTANRCGRTTGRYFEPRSSPFSLFVAACSRFGSVLAFPSRASDSESLRAYNREVAESASVCSSVRYPATLKPSAFAWAHPHGSPQMVLFSVTRHHLPPPHMLSSAMVLLSGTQPHHLPPPRMRSSAMVLLSGTPVLSLQSCGLPRHSEAARTGTARRPHFVCARVSQLPCLPSWVLDCELRARQQVTFFTCTTVHTSK